MSLLEHQISINEVERLFCFDGVRCDATEYGPDLRVLIHLSKFDRATRDRVSDIKTSLYRSYPAQDFQFIVIDESEAEVNPKVS